ncbi:MAG TPA: hypothetical protein VGS15_10400, partial [Candidatus Acidoferrales bacterium]|nr:hypothetical protein [Candidatus Acidoferrales bacterium]
AYKDPMNRTDGSWRLIYVTPAGQLIGSVRYVTLQEMALADRARIMGLQMGQGTGSDNAEGANPSASPAGDDQNPSANPNSTPPNSPPGAPPAGGGGAGTPPGTQPPDQSGQSANSQPPNSQQPGAPQPAPPQPTPFGLPLQSQPSTDQVQDATILGGFIVGVASKIDKPSLKTYKGGISYKQWEFIYNPLEQVQTIGGGAIIGGATGNANGFGLPVPQPPQPQIPH